MLSPGNPNVGHAPSGSARRQRESFPHLLFGIFDKCVQRNIKIKILNLKHHKHTAFTEHDRLTKISTLTQVKTYIVSPELAVHSTFIFQVDLY